MSSVQASRAVLRTMLCLGVPHACLPSQRALHVFTNPPLHAVASVLQQHKTSSSFISDRVESNIVEKENYKLHVSMSGVC